MLQICLGIILSSHHITDSTRRNGLKLLIPKVRTESAKKGSFYSGAQAFNNLPPFLKKVESLVVLKRSLRISFYRATLYIVFILPCILNLFLGLLLL